MHGVNVPEFPEGPATNESGRVSQLVFRNWRWRMLPQARYSPVRIVKAPRKTESDFELPTLKVVRAERSLSVISDLSDSDMPNPSQRRSSSTEPNRLSKPLRRQENNLEELNRHFHLLRSTSLSLTDISMQDTIAIGKIAGGKSRTGVGFRITADSGESDIDAERISRQSSIAGRSSITGGSATASHGEGMRSVSPEGHHREPDDFPVGFHQRSALLPLLLGGPQAAEELCISRPDTAFQIDLPAATAESSGHSDGELQSLVPYYITPRTLSRMKSSGRRLTRVFGFRDAGPAGAGLFLVEVRARGRGAVARLAALQAAGPPILSSQPGAMSRAFLDERRERNRQIEREWEVGALEPPRHFISLPPSASFSRPCLFLPTDPVSSHRPNSACTSSFPLLLSPPRPPPPSSPRPVRAASAEILEQERVVGRRDWGRMQSPAGAGGGGELQLPLLSFFPLVSLPLFLSHIL